MSVRREKRRRWTRPWLARLQLRISHGSPWASFLDGPPRKARRARSSTAGRAYRSARRACQTPELEEIGDQQDDDDQRAQTDNDWPAHVVLSLQAKARWKVSGRPAERFPRLTSAPAALEARPDHCAHGHRVIRPRQLVLRVCRGLISSLDGEMRFSGGASKPIEGAHSPFGVIGATPSPSRTRPFRPKPIWVGADNVAGRAHPYARGHL